MATECSPREVQEGVSGKGLWWCPATFPACRAWLGHRCLGKLPAAPRPHPATRAFYSGPLDSEEPTLRKAENSTGLAPSHQTNRVALKCTLSQNAIPGFCTGNNVCELPPGGALTYKGPYQWALKAGTDTLWAGSSQGQALSTGQGQRSALSYSEWPRAGSSKLLSRPWLPRLPGRHAACFLHAHFHLGRCYL